MKECARDLIDQQGQQLRKEKEFTEKLQIQNAELLLEIFELKKNHKEKQIETMTKLNSTEFVLLTTTKTHLATDESNRLQILTLKTNLKTTKATLTNTKNDLTIT